MAIGEEKPLEDKAKEAAQAAIAPKPSRHYRAQILQGYVIAATIAFGVLFFLARSIIYFPIDLRITLGVQTLRAGWFDVLMRLVSTLGYSPQVFFLIAFTALALFLIGLRWEAVVTLIAAAGISVLGTVVKIVVERPRPSPELIHVNNPALDGGKFSFTAGHVESYIAIFGFLWFLAYMSQNRSVGRTLVLVILGALITLIGVSRVYSGEHWFSDIVGAYLLGSTWLILTIHVYEWGKTRFLVEGRSKAKQPT